MQKRALSILFLLVMAGLPSAAYAVTATIKVLDDSGVTKKTYEFAAPGANPLNLSNTATVKGYGDGTGCETLGSSTSGRCFTITGQAHFFVDGVNVGQLKLEGLISSSKFVVTNKGTVTARITIEYKHTNTATDPKKTTICAGMSGDGWFSGTSSTSNKPFFEQTMAVVFTTGSGGKITNNVSGSSPGTCDDAVVAGSGTSPLFYQVGVTGTSKFYNPQIPKQVFQRVPTCSTCKLGAELNKVLTVRLPAGGVNSHVGTHFGSMCEVPGKNPPAADFFDCIVAQGSLYIAKEARFVVNNSTLHDDRKGKIVGDLLGGENFNVDDVKTDPTTGLPLCVLFAGDSTVGGSAVHSVPGDFDGDGILDLRMQFENADVAPEVGDEEVRLECQAAITVNGVTTDQTIITADEVVVVHGTN